MTGQSKTPTGAASSSFHPTDEDRSKDKFFDDVAALSNSMVAAHGRDFAMGTLILAARFIAENKAFNEQSKAAECCGGACQSDGKHEHGHASHKS